MRREQYRPEWNEPHLLSFVTDSVGDYVAIHADLAGITKLIDELEGLREQLVKNDCPHTHLFSPLCAGYELTESKLADQKLEVNVVCHVKIYGWNEEWKRRHNLVPPDSPPE